MADIRKKDFRWKIGTTLDGMTSSADAHLATLMDIRDELKALNQHLRCPNFMTIPHTLKGIRRKIPAPKPRIKQ